MTKKQGNRGLEKKATTTTSTSSRTSVRLTHPEALPLALQPEDERLPRAVKLFPVLERGDEQERTLFRHQSQGNYS